jgi:hypothetical protein
MLGCMAVIHKYCEGENMWKTRQIIRPGNKGARQLLVKYGSKLISIRFRKDEIKEKRIKTVELMEEKVNWKPRKSRKLVTRIVQSSASICGYVMASTSKDQNLPVDELPYDR